MSTLSPQCWYFFGIFPRDLEEAQWSFVGKVLFEEGPELVLRDQRNHLYYLGHVRSDIEGDSIHIRCETAEAGESAEEIYGRLTEIYGEDFQPPKILVQLQQMLRSPIFSHMMTS